MKQHKDTTAKAMERLDKLIDLFLKDRYFNEAWEEQYSKLRSDLKLFLSNVLSTERTKSREEYKKEVEKLLEELSDYAEHEPQCIRSQFSAGRPTKSGGYEQKFAGKWYKTRPVDKTPKCDCGLSDIFARLPSQSDI